ncbi:MAG: homoserine kinase [Leptospirillia bacterium]
MTFRTLSVYAPASVGNIGPGFDTLGMAVTGMGDTLSATLDPSLSKDVIERITGAWTSLPTDPRENTASIALRLMLDRAGESRPFRLVLEKGVPGSGLGSSAASAVGGAYLGNLLAGDIFSPQEILDAALTAEAGVSGGVFLDNISACLFGGVTVSHGESRTALPAGFLEGIHLVFVIPKQTLRTSESRKILPELVPRHNAIGALSNTAGILLALLRQDPALFCQRVHDPLIEPYRKALIPGFEALRESALQAGASGFAISGAGSTTVALTHRSNLIPILIESLRTALAKLSIEALVMPSSIDPKGVRRANS